MSSKKDDNAKHTYGTVSDKYDEWSKTAPPRRPARPGAPETNTGFSMAFENNITRAVVGFAVLLGLAWLAIVALVVSTVVPGWAAIDRDAAVVGYLVVAFFLALAGFGAIFGSLNHLRNVLNPERRAAHGHH
jgi:hypothetical protein